jgi:hypothetical protein
LGLRLRSHDVRGSKERGSRTGKLHKLTTFHCILPMHSNGPESRVACSGSLSEYRMIPRPRKRAALSYHWGLHQTRWSVVSEDEATASLEHLRNSQKMLRRTFRGSSRNMKMLVTASLVLSPDWQSFPIGSGAPRPGYRKAVPNPASSSARLEVQILQVVARSLPARLTVGDGEFDPTL